MPSACNASCMHLDIRLLEHQLTKLCCCICQTVQVPVLFQTIGTCSGPGFRENRSHSEKSGLLLEKRNFMPCSESKIWSLWIVFNLNAYEQLFCCSFSIVLEKPKPKENKLHSIAPVEDCFSHFHPIFVFLGLHMVTFDLKCDLGVLLSLSLINYSKKNGTGSHTPAPQLLLVCLVQQE